MRDLHFKLAKAQNFLCFGDVPVEIKFEKYGNIVLIRGHNLDATIKADEDQEAVKVASNGVGKSSIPEILVYTLFGKTIKKPEKISHRDVINNQSGKKLCTEVIWDKYRVVRTRKPDTLRLWESDTGVWDEDTEITLGGMPETQKLIQEKLGLSYESFVNVVVFTDDNNSAFLECDTPKKRQIVDNLLSLEKYRSYSETAKRLLKEAKDKIKVLGKEYELLLHDKSVCEDRVIKIEKQQIDWKTARQQELKRLEQTIQIKETELAQSDEGKALLEWQKAQEQLSVLNAELPVEEAKVAKTQSQIDSAKVTYHGLLQKQGIVEADARRLHGDIRALLAKNSEIEKEIKELEDKDGTTCHFCHGEIQAVNYQHVRKHGMDIIVSNQELLVTHQEELKGINAKIKQFQEGVTKLQEGIHAATDKLDRQKVKIQAMRGEIAKYMKVREPHANSAALLLEQQIAEWKTQAAQKKIEADSPGPFVEILKSAVEEVQIRTKSCSDKHTEIKTCEFELPYYEYWIKAFGDNGIRKFVIDGIIPALNSRIAYWLQFLIDNKIELKFDNQLEESIKRCPEDGSPFIYYVLSNGQRRRLNLSVSQAFAYVMMLNCGASPSLVFLDEVTTNIDPVGVVGIYNMICELSKEKQVFVTTHDQDLLSLLHGCDAINLQMKNGVTTLQ